MMVKAIYAVVPFHSKGVEHTAYSLGQRQRVVYSVVCRLVGDDEMAHESVVETLGEDGVVVFVDGRMVVAGGTGFVPLPVGVVDSDYAPAHLKVQSEKCIDCIDLHQ